MSVPVSPQEIEADRDALQVIADRDRKALLRAVHALKVIAGGGWDFTDQAQARRTIQMVASNALSDLHGDVRQAEEEEARQETESR